MRAAVSPGAGPGPAGPPPQHPGPRPPISTALDPAPARRHGRNQLRIIRMTMALIGIRPGPVEHEFPIGMGFEVKRQGTDEDAFRIARAEMLGQPAALGVGGTAVLQGRQELMAQERVLPCETVPLRGAYVVDAFMDLHLHGASLARSVLLGEALEVLVRVQGGHAAGTGGSDRLAVYLIHDVAGGEYARHAGGGGAALDPAFHHDVTVLHRELPGEELGIG